MIKNYFLLIAFLLAGCSSIEQTIYLQNVNVNGPLNNPPVFITQENAGIQISPRLSINSVNALAEQTNHSGVNSYGYYQVDTVYVDGKISYKESNTNTYKYNHNNVNWNLPRVTAGLDIDLPASKSISFFGSLNYSTTDQYDLTGGSFGIGFKNVTKGSAVRFNIGCTIQQYQYDASTVVVSTITPYLGEKFTRVDFYHDANKKSNYDLFVNFTYNTIIPDFPVNFYCSLAWFSQTILNFTPRTLDLYNYYQAGYDNNENDLNIESSTRFLSVTPGVYIALSPLMRLDIGFNILWDTGGTKVSTDQSASSLFIMPMAKIDFLF